MGKNLYDLSKQLDEVRDDALLQAKIKEEPVGDYVTPLLDSVGSNNEDTLIKAALLYKDVETFVGSISDEIKRLNNLKKIHNSELEIIKSYITDNMDEGDRLKTSQVEIKWTSSKAVEVKVDADELPDEYKRIKVEPNKKLITESIKNGIDLSQYAELKENKNIKIK